MHRPEPISPPPAPVPPTRPGPLRLKAANTHWPTRLGILALTFGVCGVLFHAAGLVLAAGDPALVSADGVPTMVMEQFGPGTAPFVIFYSGSLALSAYLTLAAIRLLRRHASAPAHAARWAVAKIIQTAFALLIAVEMTRASSQIDPDWWDDAGPPSAAATLNAVNTGLLWTVGTWTVLWGLWFPVLMLWWFRRPKVRAQVAGWNVGPGTIPPTVASR